MKLSDGIQTKFQVIEGLGLLKTTIMELEELIFWSDVGILFDKDNKATLILLLDNSVVNGVLRFSLHINESIEAIRKLKKSGVVFLGGYGDGDFTTEQICSLDKLNNIWTSISGQIAIIDLDTAEEFFKRAGESSKKTGRGKNFSTETIRTVMQDSHGYCMFRGCGQDLRFEKLTGKLGNFSYLAHNVASSENGTRGMLVLSDIFSDDPNNVLLLCDKHHRLIDKVATLDYPASKLSVIRKDFILTTKKLLKGLAYQPIPVFSIMWPVAGASVSSPSEEQISQCLGTIEARLLNQVNHISDNEAILKATTSNEIWAIMPGVIDRVSNEINNQIRHEKFKAGLFAFGPMPSLIALGAKLGNKNEIIPMLRYRDGGRWVWPSDQPLGSFYDTNGIEALTDKEGDIVISLITTREPKSLINASKQISKNKNAKIIEIRSKELGNGSLAHPVDGIAFSAYIQKLLHDLKDDHGVKNIHLLPCASNAVCIFFGQAFDNYHPDITIYDFHEETMIPRLKIKSKDNECKLFALQKLI